MKLKDIDIHSVGNTRQLAGAVFRGEGKMLLALFPDDRGDLMNEDTNLVVKPYYRDALTGSDEDVHVLDMDHEDWKVFLRQTDLLEAKVLAEASDGTLAKIVLRKSARQISQQVSWNVFKRDGYKCRYCGRDDVPLTVDHLVLWEDGGPSIEQNLVSACKKCNKTRGNTPYAEWLKHPRYLRTSEDLEPSVRFDNEAMVGALDDIPRMYQKHSKR